MGTNQTVNSIPVNALVSADGKKGKVFTINNERAVETIITIYKMEDHQLLVSDGLVEDQEVVISGIDNIRNADHVVVSNTKL